MPTPTVYEAFLTKLKALRLERGMTHGDIAEAIGLSRAQYTAIENGRSMVTFWHLHNLAVVLKAEFNIGGKKTKVVRNG